ncbi:hypothetical protein TWF694_004142 [Orbilia ellipsospora]|uniref:Carrier domain-containing protein n=1 Tax=Orbilia ellipsospora TaxID=2528407 RepID=A0AAV9WZB7_9PEZI
MMSAMAHLNPSTFAGVPDSVGVTGQKPQQATQQSSALPVIFPNLTGRANPAPRGSLPLQKCLLTYDIPLSILQQRCASLGVSIGCFCQSVWARLLSQYTGEPEVSFGAFESDAPFSAPEPGACLCKVWRRNTHIIDVAFAPGKTDNDVRRELKDLSKEHRADFYETVLSVYSAGYETPQIAQAATDSEFIVHVEVFLNTKVDLVQLTLHYDPAYVTGDSSLLIAREFFGALTLQSGGQKDEQAGSLRLHSDILSISQRASEKAPVDTTDKRLFVHRLFERHADTTPERICLEFLHDKSDEIESWTFGELNETSNRIAHLIIDNGIARDEAIPVCLDKGPLFYACILACMKAGVPFTPIDPVIPVARKAFMIEELQARYIISTPEQFKLLEAPVGVNLLNISNTNSLKKFSSQNPQVIDLTEKSLAYRLYTSGSTGQPKAVSLEVGSVVHAVQQSISLLPLHHDTRLLQFAAITFDMCYFDCFLAWAVGFTLISASKRHLLGELEDTARRLQISFLDLTPSVAATLNATELPQIEMLYCIGEAMPTKIVQDWEGRCVNSYGPTEAAMLCTITNVSKETKSANFGEPFSGMSLYILDKETPTILPRMAVGELCISGPQLAREYHRNKSKTASSFIYLGSGLRVYRTGDLARMLADGTFEFIGRKDDQVKLRGFRIELGEVSAVLRNCHPLIKDIVTLVLKHSEQEKEQLVAFLSFTGRKNRLEPPSVQDCDEFDWEDIEKSARKAAETALPQYMLPHIYFPINWIPLSAAAKVDKRSLSELFQQSEVSNFGRRSEVNTPGSEEELDDVSIKIRDIFAEISNSNPETIGVDTTIYQLGLDSISALAVSRSLKAIGVNASVLDIIEYPTIRGLGAHVLGKENQVSTTHSQDLFASFKHQYIGIVCESAGVPRNKVTNVLPCSPMQEGILSQFILSKGALYYNSILFQLDNLDLNKLERAWRQVAERNDILRTGFVEHEADGGHYAMVVHESASSSSFRRVETQIPIEELMLQIKNEETQKILSNIAIPPWCVTIVSGPSSYMIFTALHAIYDAQTLQIILSDVEQLYLGYEPAIHPRFTPILKDMLHISRDKEAISCAADYWRSILQDCPVAKFPIMTPLCVESGDLFASYKKCTVTMKEVEDLCKKAGFSLGAVGQATWAKLLAMYFGESDICFGSVISGRTGADYGEDLVFPCLTTIPMRVQLIGDNRSLVTQIQGRITKMLKFQHTPLRAIQRALGNPEQKIFDTIFVYQRSVKTNHESKTLWQELDAKAAVEYPVSFEIEPTDDGYLGLRLTGKTNIIPKEQMEAMIAQFEYCLLHILEHQDSDVMDLDDAPIEILSDTPADVDRLPCEVQFLHDFVSVSTERHPQKVALEFATAIQADQVTKDSWTYRQFNDMGNKIANFLLQHGAVTGDLIGICFDKTPEAYFGILGILKAGCAFVALDFSAPVQRRSFIVQDAGIKIVLTMSQFEGDFGSIDNLRVFSLDNLQILTKYFSAEKPEISDLTPDHLSYVLYTSGTTGTPKGCRITHENAVQAMLSFQTLFKGHWDENSRFLQFASLHFDVSVLEQYWSWSVGICMTGASRDLIFQDIGNAIRALDITHIDLTPSLARLINPEETPSLCRGVFITGGEKLKQDVLDAWGEKDVIYNGYGPTEATIGVTMYPRVPRNGRPSNIGPQFVNVGSMVVKPKTNIPVLRGAVGELCVTGALVGDGYLNREDLTKERFPYVNGKRMYRTGDLVRQLHNGCFDYLGRADDQVKLRGQRLELGEINETIRGSDQSIAEIVTLVCQHGQQQVQQLVSFVSFKSGSGNSSSSPGQLLTSFPAVESRAKILHACQSKLPIYMIPTYVLPITKLPLTVNNKVDERTLRSLFANTSMDVIQAFEESSEENEEFSDIEQTIRDTLAEVSIDPTSAAKHTSFFQLGLDSVSIVGFSNRLRKRGFQNVEVSTVMQNPTISSLAKVLSSSFDSGPAENTHLQNALQDIKAFGINHSFEVCSTLGLKEEDIETIMPCTPLQEGMIARALNADNSVYYNTFWFKISQNITPKALQEAWQKVVDRSDILRTCFCETSDGIAQVVLKSFQPKWEVVKIKSKRSLQLKKSNTQRLSMSDITTPPIALEYVFSLKPKSKHIRLSIFHALYDGISMAMILSDVEDLLSGRQLVNRMTFASIVPRILSLDLEGAKNFWIDHLASAEVNLIEPQTNSPEAKEHHISHVLQFSQKDIEEVARKLDCTVQALFQIVSLQALARVFKKQLGIGLITSGRSFAVDGIETCIGPLFNTIPCYLPIVAGTTWKDYAKRAHTFNTRSVPYHHTPLRRISKWAGNGSKPLFDVLFTFQPAASFNAKFLEEVDSSAIPDYPVALEIQKNNNGQYIISITSNPSYISKYNTSQLLTSMVTGIANLLENTDGEVLDLGELGEHSLKSEIQHDSTSSTPDPITFKWTRTAEAIRQELSALTDVPENEINEKSSIYQIGLDSVEAIRLSSRLQKKGIPLKVSDIMRESTIKRMIRYLESYDIQTLLSAASMINMDLKNFDETARQALKVADQELQDAECIFPTTPLQDVMVAEAVGSDFTLYFNHDVLELQKEVNIEKLQVAWTNVIKRTPILRTTFKAAHELGLNTPGDYIQVVRKEVSLEWDTIEASHTNESDKIDELIASHKSRRTQLALGIIKSSNRTLLVLSILHALYDGQSMGLLLEDVAREYDGYETIRPDYTPFLSQILNLNMENSIRFWKQQMLKTKPQAFPAASQGERIWKTDRKSKVTAPDFIQFCRMQHISEPVLGQVCWSLVLSDIFEQDDVVFGTIISGRETEESEGYIFPTMNTIPIRVVFHGTIRDTLKSMQQNYSKSLEHQFVALRDIQRNVCEPGCRIFDTLFVYQKHKSPGGQATTLWKSVGGTSQIEYPIAVEIEVIDDSLTWRIFASNHVMTMEDTQNTVIHLDTILQKIIDNPLIRYRDFSGSSLASNIRNQIETQSGLHSDVTEDVVDIDSIEHKALEERIILAISTVSKVDANEIKLSSSIFHLGIDSISAIRLSSEFRKKAIFIAVSEIMREATVGKIFQFVAKKQQNSTNKPKPSGRVQSEITAAQFNEISELAGLKHEEIESISTATAGQTFLIKAWESSQGRIFLPTFSFKVQESLRSPKLKRSVERLISHNSILRATFVNKEDTVFQVIHKQATPSFRSTYFDSDSISISNLQNINKQEQTRLYDMTYPSIRVHLVSNKRESYVFLTLHHALYDAFTLPTLLSQLSDIYQNEDMSLSPLRNSILPSSTPESRRFWVGYLKGAESTLLPVIENYNGDATERIEFYTEKQIPNGIKIDDSCRRHGISLYSLSIACFGQILSSLTMKDSPIIGVYLSNRHLTHQDDELHDTMPTLNMVPIVVRNASKAALLDVAKQVQGDLLDISTGDAAMSSLLEIYRWTGIKVDSFFNFLKEDSLDSNSRSGGLFDRFDLSTEYSSPREFSIPTALRSGESTIQTNLDLEMASRNGSIDVGLFAARKCLDKTKLESISDTLKNMLLDFK